VVVVVLRGKEEAEGSGVDVVVVGGPSVDAEGVRFCGWWSFVMSSSSKSMITVVSLLYAMA
jgi:hypothetical protein